MEPTFFDGQIVLTTALNTRLQKGDVVIVKDPFSPEENICKRIVGKIFIFCSFYVQLLLYKRPQGGQGV